jgi:hypothetical protein
MQALPCEKTVYRAIRKSWLDKETKSVLPIAFMRRLPPNDELGISVDTESPQSCALALSNCHVASLRVGRIRDLGLNVIPNEPKHANITGLPRSLEDQARAERLASQLARQARFIPPEDYQPVTQ